jgi:hypothetical protein
MDVLDAVICAIQDVGVTSASDEIAVSANLIVKSGSSWNGQNGPSSVHATSISQKRTEAARAQCF